jgi:hypothetical protein
MHSEFVTAGMNMPVKFTETQCMSGNDCDGPAERVWQLADRQRKGQSSCGSNRLTSYHAVSALFPAPLLHNQPGNQFCELNRAIRAIFRHGGEHLYLVVHRGGSF